MSAAVPACAACDVYRAPKDLPEGVSEHVLRPKGKCQRYPTAVDKDPDDWCGEFRSVDAKGKR